MFSGICKLLILERETGLEPVTSSLGSHAYVGFKSLARFCREFLKLQHFAESAFCKTFTRNEAQMRQGFKQRMRTGCSLLAPGHGYAEWKQ